MKIVEKKKDKLNLEIIFRKGRAHQVVVLALVRIEFAHKLRNFVGCVLLVVFAIISNHTARACFQVKNLPKSKFSYTVRNFWQFT